MLDSQQITVGKLLQQTVKYLIEIVEKVLEEQTFSKIFQLIRQQEEMIVELEKKMVMMVNNRNMELCSQIEEIKSFSEASRCISPRSSPMKAQRREIVENIISMQRVNSIRMLKEGSSLSLDSMQQCLNKSLQKDISEINNRLSLLEKELTFIRQQCRQGRVAQRQVEFKLTYEQKIQLNLQSIWNVITDIKAGGHMKYNT